MTRAVKSADTASARGNGRDRVLHGVLVATAVVLLGVMISAPAWGPALFGTPWLGVVIAAVLGIASLSVQVTLTGAAAARHNTALLSRLVLHSASVRALAVVAVALVSESPAALMLAVACGSASWLFMVRRADARIALEARGDATMGRFASRGALTVVSTTCTALLTTGFPLLVGITNHVSGASAGVLFAAVILTRAPLLIPMNGVQLVVIASLVTRKGSVLGAAARMGALIASLGLLGATLALVVGPWLLRLLCGPEYVLSGPTLAVMVIGATGLALLTLSGTVLLSVERRRWSLTGWLAALAGTLALLNIGGDLESRILLALVGGPVTGVVVHAAGLFARHHPGRA